MMTFETVLNIFQDYLEKDSACEVVMTSRGYTVLLWDSLAEDWSEACFSGTPDALMQTLLDNVESFEE